MFAITLRLCDFRLATCDLRTSTSGLFEPTATFLDLRSLLEGLGDPILAPQPLSTVLLTSCRSDWVFFPSRRTVGTSALGKNRARAADPEITALEHSKRSQTEEDEGRWKSLTMFLNSSSNDSISFLGTINQPASVTLLSESQSLDAYQIC